MHTHAHAHVHAHDPFSVGFSDGQAPSAAGQAPSAAGQAPSFPCLLYLIVEVVQHVVLPDGPQEDGRRNIPAQAQGEDRGQGGAA